MQAARQSRAIRLWPRSSTIVLYIVLYIYIVDSSSTTPYLYSSSTTAEQVVEFMLADKPIPTLATHSYGFHTRSGRGLRELFTENYNSYLRNNGN